ncbi:MAG: hypothetical protein HYW88_02345 [Candidatus Sungbacteria bacterium]|nr:hypothetical protein [Candidatus Sungbacteria bacterium]
MKAVLRIALIVGLLFFIPSFGEADYRPSDSVLALLKALVEKEQDKSIMGVDGKKLSLKMLQAGESYAPGEVAYFVSFEDGNFYMHLEEWVLGEDGNFHVSFWTLKVQEVIHWEWAFTPKGAPVGDTEMVSMKTDNPMSIKKSERAQELLAKYGKKI